MVQVEVKENLWNRTQGLCGRFDGILDDDMQAKDGSMPESLVTFVSSWQVDSLGGKTCKKKYKYLGAEFIITILILRKINSPIKLDLFFINMLIMILFSCLLTPDFISKTPLLHCLFFHLFCL